MSNWKPKGWDESRDVMAKECADDEKFKDSDLETLIKAMVDAGAESMLEKVCEEIEKVELTNEEISVLFSWVAITSRYGLHPIYEREKVLLQVYLQRILTLLRSENND